MPAISDETLIETPDAPEWGDLSADDPEEAGDLGQTVRRPNSAAPERPARGGSALRPAVATVTPMAIEVPLHLLFPLGPWTHALDAERRAELESATEGERWVQMVSDALDRDMRADDARDPESRHYDFPFFFDSTFGALRDRGTEEAHHRAIAAAMRPLCQGLWADTALRLTADRLSEHLACTRSELADWLGVTPERLAAEDAARRQAWRSTVDLHREPTEEDGDA